MDATSKTPATRTVLGLDLGQASDYTALAGIQANGQDAAKRTVWSLPILRRWALHTTYPDIVTSVADICGKLVKPTLVVDATGCGRPVVDLFRQASLPVAELVALTITAGNEAHRSGPDGWNVPKRDLVAAALSLLQSQRLKIAKGLPEAPALVKELTTFKVKVNIATGGESFEAWRSKDRDDLVLALSMACWYGETQAPPDFNFKQIKLRPDGVGLPEAEDIVFPEIRWFAQSHQYQPMPAPGGNLIACCPTFKEQAEAAYFVARIYEAMGLEPPDCVIELYAEQQAQVDHVADEFIRNNGIRPPQ